MDALAAQIVLKLLLDCTGEQKVFCSLRCSTDGAVGVVSCSNLLYTCVRYDVPRRMRVIVVSFPRSCMRAVLDLEADI